MIINLIRRLWYSHHMVSGFEWPGLILGETVAQCIAYGIRGEIRKAYDYPKKHNNLKGQKFVGYNFVSMQECGLCAFTHLPLKHFKLL